MPGKKGGTTKPSDILKKKTMMRYWIYYKGRYRIFKKVKKRIG